MAKRNSLDAKFFEGEFFAELYYKDIGIVPDKNSNYAIYADLGDSRSYIRIIYKVEGKYFDDMIEMMDAFNLISKHILEKPNKL